MLALFLDQGTKIGNRWDSFLKVLVGEREADVPRSKGASVWRGVRRKDELGGPGYVERSGECLGFP